MNSQRFILSYLPSILNLVVGLVLIIVAPRLRRRRESAMGPAKLDTLNRRVRLIGFILVGLAVLMLIGESIFGGG